MKLKIFLFLLSIYTLGYSQSASQKKMAVTIDDLPLQGMGKYSVEQVTKTTDRLLSKIAEMKSPVTAFVIGNKIMTDGKPDPRKIAMLEKWLDAGLDLGNHTYSHPSANKVSIDEYKKDILAGDQAIRNIIERKGKTLKHFRYPYLQTGRSIETKTGIENFLKEHGYTIAPVTLDNGEWIFSAAYEHAIDSSKTDMMKKIGAEYVDYMKRKVEYWESQSEGLFGRNINHILLMHANTLNSDYYAKLLEMFRADGYEFISVDEALSDEAYKLENTYTGAGGISELHRWAVTQGKKGEFFGDEPEVPEYIMKYARVKSE